MKTTYTAINIGPIVQTLGMARKPRELWAASYLFSHLMKCIIDVLPSDKIISPALFDKDEKNGVGLYPDRVFVKGEIDTEELYKNTRKMFFSTLKMQEDDSLWRYFNIMSTSCEAENAGTAVSKLNNQLNILELMNFAKNDIDLSAVRNLLDPDSSTLIKQFFPSKDYMTLGEIAAIELKSKDEGWGEFVDALKSKEKEISSKAYGKLNRQLLKSYHKYICVVQADGDNVGKTISNDSLTEKEVGRISSALLKFGTDAAEKIKEFGGLPIYAGGDDLLFISPVVGINGKNIFQLLDTLNSKSFAPVKIAVEKAQEGMVEKNPASLSFGVSVSYYKYPLYESLNTAREDLLDNIAKDKYETKNLIGKNAIAFKLQKHSGSGFNIAFSKNNKEDFVSRFNELIEKTKDGNTVSAVAHKIRSNYDLIKMVLESQDSDRLDAVFDKVLECTGTSYFDAVKDIMPLVYSGIINSLVYVEKQQGESDAEYQNSQYGYALYNILRTAKFLKGEEPLDE